MNRKTNAFHEIIFAKHSRYTVWSISILKGSLSITIAKSTPFIVSKDEWETKEDAECIVRMPKGTSWDEAMLNSVKLNPVALAVIELSLFKGISQ